MQLINRPQQLHAPKPLGSLLLGTGVWLCSALQQPGARGETPGERVTGHLLASFSPGGAGSRGLVGRQGKGAWQRTGAPVLKPPQPGPCAATVVALQLYSLLITVVKSERLGTRGCGGGDRRRLRLIWKPRLPNSVCLKK